MKVITQIMKVLISKPITMILEILLYLAINKKKKMVKENKRF